jgi:dTDP-4-dehydrorhamnose reductase
MASSSSSDATGSRLIQPADPLRAAPSLVVGGDSMIGRALIAALDAAGETPFATTRRRADVEGRRLYADLEAGEWGDLLPLPFASAYLCAAMARLDDCYADPDRAMRVNAIQTARLAADLAARGCYVLLLSTNQVFDGRRAAPHPDDPTTPANVYGVTKAAAERRILTLADDPQAVAPGVLRLSKVVEPGMALFASWVSRLRSGQEISAARDMALAPLPVAQVVDAMRAMASHRLPGIVQLAAAREISYVDAALHVARRVGAPARLVRAVDSVAAGFLKEQPPPHTILDGSRAFRELGIEPVDPFAALDACLAPLMI